MVVCMGEAMIGEEVVVVVRLGEWFSPFVGEVAVVANKVHNDGSSCSTFPHPFDGGAAFQTPEGNVQLEA